MPVVTTIPATHKPFAKKMRGLAKRRKVAGYARVSTDHEEQQTSYEAQMSYYSEMIRANPEWEFVGMYSDEGITATNTHHREGFKSMIDDALGRKNRLNTDKICEPFRPQHSGQSCNCSETEGCKRRGVFREGEYLDA